MTRMPGMVRMIMSGITVIFANGLDGEQLFALFPDSGFLYKVINKKYCISIFINKISRTYRAYGIQQPSCTHKSPYKDASRIRLYIGKNYCTLISYSISK